MTQPVTPAQAVDQLRKDWATASPNERRDIEFVADKVKLLDLGLNGGTISKRGKR